VLTDNDSIDQHLVMGFPLPPKSDLSMLISTDEISLILRKCLKPEHHDNPYVLRFINEYIFNRDARQSAKAIGLPPHVGVRMRAKPDIFEAIKEITERAVLKYGYDAEEIVEKVKEIAFVDPGDLENEDGSFVESLKKLSPEVRRAIKKFKAKNEYGTDPNGMPVVTGKVIEVEFWDKMRAAELLGREKEIFKETKRVEHDMGRTMASTLLASKDRAESKASEVRDVIEVGVRPQMPAPPGVKGG